VIAAAFARADFATIDGASAARKMTLIKRRAS